MRAVVHSDDGNAVKLRNSPSRSEKLWWNVPDGTPVMVMERGNLWSRIQTGERVGYMLTSFLKMEKEKAVLSFDVPAEIVPEIVKILEDAMNQLRKEVNENDDL